MTSNQRQRKPKEKTLQAVRPNAGIEAAYRKRLVDEIEAMHKSVVYWLTSTYRNNEPLIAQDETPAEALRKSVRKMSRQWIKRFDTMSDKLADYFAQSVQKRSSDALKKILKDGGWTVEFKMTPAMRDVFGATVNQNVSLIKSIPEQYLSQVEGIVMRGVQNGRDLGVVAKELEERLGVTKRRAALISRDQNNKATAAMTRARHLELGLDEAQWCHSAGGKDKRPTHVKASQDKTTYKISQGWYDPAVKAYIQPGELIGCKCFPRPVLKGFS